MSKRKIDDLAMIELNDIEEFKGLRLSPQEISFIMNYLSPSCGFDANKAYRMTIGEDEFKEMSKGKFYARSRTMMQNEEVKTAIKRMLTKDVEKKKEEIIPTIINDLLVASTYDPAQIIDDDGDLLNGALSDIPQRFRRAVIEGIEVKYWGKDCDYRTRTVKLASKSKARSQLMDLMKLLSNLENGSAENNAFTVNINTTNIEGMPTAEELFGMSVVGKAEMVEEDE